MTTPVPNPTQSQRPVGEICQNLSKILKTYLDREEPAPTFNFEPDTPADLPDVDYDDDFEADDPMPPR